jgi:hypothetical protein
MKAAPLAFQSFVQLCFFTPSSLSCFLHILSFFGKGELSKERNITEGNELKSSHLFLFLESHSELLQG